jgi:hypothetical protein
MDLSHENLTELPINCPKKIIGWFTCSHNLLTNLKGCPEIVTGGFYCHNNKLTTLENGPKEVGGFYCVENPNLSLKQILKFMSKCKIGGIILTDYGELTGYKNKKLSDKEILKIMLRMK